MPFVDAQTQSDTYDAIVVGSGAGGGQSAYTLAMEGREGVAARGRAALLA